MENLIATTPDAIRKASEMLDRVRPACSQVIRYYQKVFEAQETAKADMTLPEIQIPRNRPALQSGNDFPLISPEEFRIDAETSVRLMEKICKITESAGIQTSPAAGRLKKMVNSGEIDIETLFTEFFKPESPEIDALAQQLETDSRFVRIILYHSFKPAFETGSTRLGELLKEKPVTNTRFCPVCGSQPVLASLGASGERTHFCGLCWHQWSFHRAHCPFCEKHDEKVLTYLYSETEKEYRVDICETCGIYMKCIDLREISRVVYPPLETAATLHLDLKAREAGYRGTEHFIY